MRSRLLSMSFVGEGVLITLSLLGDLSDLPGEGEANDLRDLAGLLFEIYGLLSLL